MTEAARPKPRSRLLWGRPRFVVALVVLASVLAPAEAWRGLQGQPSWTAQFVLGPGSAVATSALALSLSLFYVALGFGLWRKLRWARNIGMVWLGGLLAAVLFLWSPDGYGAGAASGALLWQLFAVPFLTFAMMYLYQGSRWFR